MKEAEPIQINFQITDVSNKCIRHIKKTTEITSLTYYAIQNFTEAEIMLLEVDALPIGFNDPEEIPSDQSLKERATGWLFRKAFEEFIVGTTESLIEAHKAINLLALSQRTVNEKIKRDEVLKQIEEINKKPLRLHLPVLVKDIETALNIKLPFASELLTVNQVRNCMVHRNSIVTEKDINDPANNALKLSFVELVVLSEKEGKIIEVKKEDKNPGFRTNKIGIHTRAKELIFKKDLHVNIDATTFNNIALTCILFVTNLLQSIPLPDGQKLK